MTAKVNLLPDSTRRDAAKSQQRLLAAVLVVVVVVGLAAATWLQRGVLQDAEDELADAEFELAAANQEVTDLAPFADLDQRLTSSSALLAETLGDESTLAGILQDLALVVPSEGALTSMTLTLDGTDGSNVGSMTATAEVLSSHAPGVERFLLQLERAAGFRNVYPGASTIDEDDIATFPVSIELGREYLTGRYADGLPEVER